MNCIFCKKKSSGSKSHEHIVPQSLGNLTQCLPPGVVCDKCNNYFSHKIEKKLLDQSYFKNLRFRNEILSKKGKTPYGSCFLQGSEKHADIKINNSSIKVIITDQKDFEKLKTGELKTLYLPIIEKPDSDNRIISRFLGKVALESLATLGLKIENGIDDIINDTGLDPLRNYVRYNKGENIWPYYLRRIYPEIKLLKKPEKELQIMFEYKLFFTNEESGEVHLSIAIMGIEYTINIYEPTTESYKKWLKENNYKSPLDV